MSMPTPQKRSIIFNTVLSYAGQAYALLVGILIMPFYLRHLGAEAYGLIGFYAVLQAWLQLLDVGLSPSLVREVAHYQGQSAEQARLRLPGQLLRSFEIIFLPLALVSFLSAYVASPWISKHWLNTRALGLGTLISCIDMMGVMVALRLFASLYKSGLQGMEQHGLLNGINVIIATVRYFGGLWLVAWISQDPVVFFKFQVAVALIEMLMFAVPAYRWLPAPSLFSGFNKALVKPLMPFAASMSLTSILWIVLTQMDKVLLSKALMLKEYGYFSLVALIATGILMLANPLVQTLLPRMTVLMAEGRREEANQLYLGASRLVGTFLIPMAAIIAVHTRALIYAWTGDYEAAEWGHGILGWYAWGSAIMAISAFQFYLQYAHRKIHLHVWYTLISALVTVPTMLYAVKFHGAYGAAITWFLLRAVSLALWSYAVHRQLAPGIHNQWLYDIVRISLMSCLGLLITDPLYQLFADGNRFEMFLGLALCCAITLLIVAASHKPLLQRIALLFSKASA